MKQLIISVHKDFDKLDKYIQRKKVKRILLVCGKSLFTLKIGKYFETICERLGVEIVQFSDFSPNPLYSSVVKGVNVFNHNNCDLIIAAGGGSTIDVAKCIKLFSNMNNKSNYLKQKIIPNDICIIAIPTTAGTGSESNRYAVIYYEGEKQSIVHDSCLPDLVVFDGSVLDNLPKYQKKVTMLDALCHALESYWSVNSTKESREYAGKAIRIIMQNKDAYLRNDNTVYMKMLEAANLSGKAINISQTTAGHAMSYKLTSLYGISHGHAVALCVEELWPYMIQNINKCIDTRGTEYLTSIFTEIANYMGFNDAIDAAIYFKDMLKEMCLDRPKAESAEQIDNITDLVNPIRLKNTPIELDKNTIRDLYDKILG